MFLKILKYVGCSTQLSHFGMLHWVQCTRVSWESRSLLCGEGSRVWFPSLNSHVIARKRCPLLTATVVENQVPLPAGRWGVETFLSRSSGAAAARAAHTVVHQGLVSEEIVHVFSPLHQYFYLIRSFLLHGSSFTGEQRMAVRLSWARELRSRCSGGEILLDYAKDSFSTRLYRRLPRKTKPPKQNNSVEVGRQCHL